MKLSATSLVAISVFAQQAAATVCLPDDACQTGINEDTVQLGRRQKFF